MKIPCHSSTNIISLLHSDSVDESWRGWHGTLCLTRNDKTQQSEKMKRWRKKVSKVNNHQLWRFTIYKTLRVRNVWIRARKDVDAAQNAAWKLIKREHVPFSPLSLNTQHHHRHSVSSLFLFVFITQNFSFGVGVRNYSEIIIHSFRKSSSWRLESYEKLERQMSLVSEFTTMAEKTKNKHALDDNS